MEPRKIVHKQRNMKSDRPSAPPRSRWRRILLIAGLTFLLFVLAFGGLIATVYAANDLERLPDGMKAGGWEFGGMSIDDYHTELDRRMDLILQRELVIESDEEVLSGATFTLEQLGFSLEAKELTEAIEDLQTGSWFERLHKYWALRDTEFDIALQVNADQLRQVILSTWPTPAQDQPVPVSAQRIITEQDDVVLIPETNVYRVNTDLVTENIAELVQSNIMLHGGNQQAVFMELPIVVEKPPVTIESLQAEGIKRKIAEFTTSFAGSSEGRVHNIEAVAAILNGTMLKPEDVFDYADIVRMTEEETGFKEAPVIMNGRLVPGIGGGICQVTSTLYNVLLRTDIEIVERRNHSLPVSYVPLGLDATYATGWINFKFRNNTGSHLLIHAETGNDQLTIKFFGSQPDNITYELSSEVVGTIAPTSSTVQNPDLPAGTRKIIQSGKNGYIVETYRKVFEDGELLRTELVSRDTYRAQEEIVEVGTGIGDVNANEE